MDQSSEQEWYKNYYSEICTSGKPGSFSSRLLHKSIERPFKTNQSFTILEVGANRGEHLPFVTSDFEKYVLSDLILPTNQLACVNDNRISFRVANVQQLPFEDLSFDRVIATCLFLHLENPILALHEIRRVTKKGGCFSLLLPHDPGIMYRSVRRLTSLRKAKKFGVLNEAKYVHAIAHRNHFLSLKEIIKHQCTKDDISIEAFPFSFSTYDFNLFSVIHIWKSKRA
jgi:ubiquinone/menaquinone biosynthesis C-methylase UbiE